MSVSYQSFSSSSKNNIGFQCLITGVGILLFIGKLIAWRLTNSDAIFSDAMESIVNIVAAFMGLYSLYIAAKPRDEDHPYGHGKVEFVTSGIEGAMVILAGAMIIIESFDSLLYGNFIDDLDWGVVIISFTAVLNYALGYFSYKKGISERSLVLQASGKHLQSDTLTTVGVVASLLIVRITEWYWVDSLVSVIFGGYIIFIGYKIVRKALSGIMDEADIQLLESIAFNLEKFRKKEWVDVHNVKIQQYGSRLHIDGHVTLPYYFSLQEAHQEMEILIKTIANHSDRVVEFNFHMDDCKPFSCKICQLEKCPKRSFVCERKIEWTPSTISQPHKHR